MPSARIAAAPRPWRKRAATSHGSDGESAHNTDATVNTAIATDVELAQVHGRARCLRHQVHSGWCGGSVAVVEDHAVEVVVVVVPPGQHLAVGRVRGDVDNAGNIAIGLLQSAEGATHAAGGGAGNQGFCGAAAEVKGVGLSRTAQGGAEQGCAGAE